MRDGYLCFADGCSLLEFAGERTLPKWGCFSRGRGREKVKNEEKGESRVGDTGNKPRVCFETLKQTFLLLFLKFKNYFSADLIENFKNMLDIFLKPSSLFSKTLTSLFY